MFDTDFSQALHTLAIALVPALLGIILHEVAHGWVAARNGDPTARIMGRLTLNPISHIDPTGLLVFVLTSIAGSFVFGWAKPVPVDFRYFRNPKQGMMLVALAGPLTNFALAIVFALLLWAQLTFLPFGQWKDAMWYAFALSSFQMGVVINFGLGWLNLLPIPPLDGSKVLAYFLPDSTLSAYLRIERYGMVVMMALLFTGLLGKILGPLVSGSVRGVLSLLGLL